MFNWSFDRGTDESLHALGHLFRSHVRTTRVDIRQPTYESVLVFNKSLKPLNKMKWCTHLKLQIGCRVDISPISGMISLQHLDLEFGGNELKVPLEYFRI
jgi:hypothetical protein